MFALFFPWITRFEVLETIISDRGQQSTSNVWSQLCEMLHTTHQQTTAYHPELNGAVKRLHHCLTHALCARTAAATRAEEIPWDSLASMLSRGKTLAFPRLRQIMVLQLFCQINFCKEVQLLLTQFQFFFVKSSDDPAFSLLRHNSSRQLPRELPG